MSRVAEDDVNVKERTSFSFLVQNVDLEMSIVREEQEKDMEVSKLKGKLLLEEGAPSKYILIDGLLYLKPSKEGGVCQVICSS